MAITVPFFTTSIYLLGGLFWWWEIHNDNFGDFGELFGLGENLNWMQTWGFKPVCILCPHPDDHRICLDILAVRNHAQNLLCFLLLFPAGKFPDQWCWELLILGSGLQQQLVVRVEIWLRWGQLRPLAQKYTRTSPLRDEGVLGLDVMVWYPEAQAMLGWMHWLMENAWLELLGGGFSENNMNRFPLNGFCWLTGL